MDNLTNEQLEQMPLCGLAWRAIFFSLMSIGVKRSGRQIEGLEEGYKRLVPVFNKRFMEDGNEL